MTGSGDREPISFFRLTAAMADLFVNCWGLTPSDDSVYVNNHVQSHTSLTLAQPCGIGCRRTKEVKIIKKPYLKKIMTISRFVVWFVDGKYIRDQMDEEFTNFGQHYRFKFIPELEFWIDDERTPGEEEFYIDHMLIENRLMAEGIRYDEALQKADLVELRERRKVDYIKKGIKPGVKKEEYIAKVHQNLLHSYSKYLHVWVVDGELVRDLFFIDYTEGGHDKVYDFIPPREVWLDDDLQPKEIKFVLLHELHERHLMTKGFDYPKAHRSASHIEYFCRHHPEELEAKLGEEIEKNRI
jgi:hypothetical protein